MYEDISQLLVENQKKNEKTIHSLQEELDKARTESARIKRSLDRLSRAIEAIQYCPHRNACPINSELSLDQEADRGKSQRTKHRAASLQRASEHERDDSKSCEGANVCSELAAKDRLSAPTSHRGELYRTTGASTPKSNA